MKFRRTLEGKGSDLTPLSNGEWVVKGYLYMNTSEMQALNDKGWEPALLQVVKEHFLRYASDEEKAQRPAKRYFCSCGDGFADVTGAAEHLRNNS